MKANTTANMMKKDAEFHKNELMCEIKKLQKEVEILELAERIGVDYSKANPNTYVDLNMVLDTVKELQRFDDASIYNFIMSHSKIVDGKIVIE